MLGTIPQTALQLGYQLGLLRAANSMIADLGLKGGRYDRMKVLTFQTFWNSIQPQLVASGMLVGILTTDALWGPNTAAAARLVLPNTATPLPTVAAQMPTWWRAVKTTLQGDVSTLDNQLAAAIAANVPHTGDTATNDAIARTIDQATHPSAATVAAAQEAAQQEAAQGTTADPRGGETFALPGHAAQAAKPSAWPWVFGILGVAAGGAVLYWAVYRKRKRRVAS